MRLYPMLGRFIARQHSIGKERMRRGALNVGDNAGGMDSLIARIGGHARLAEADRDALGALIRGNVRSFPAHRDIFGEGERPRAVHFILEGWACRYKTLPDGRRQITAFLVPADLCGIDILMLREVDYGFGTISNVKAADIGVRDFAELLDSHPGLARAMRWNEVVDASIQREWMLNIGQRSAYERVAHLMCELFLRMRSAGLAADRSCDFPITQSDIAEATGLTAVHVNRTVQALRGDGLIELRGRRLAIADLPALMSAAMFSDSYLHPGGPDGGSQADG
jgi:CRP-like cAMP-binding protein